MDGHKAALSTNTIATHIFAQINGEGYPYALLNVIVYRRTDGSKVMADNAFIKRKNGGHLNCETTKGWDNLLQRKDGKTTWENLKDIEECYPLDMAKHAVEKDIIETPAFA